MLNGVKETKALLEAMEQGEKSATNGDRIRAMSDEELADFVGNHSLCDRIQDRSDWCDKRAVCRNCLTEWLRQPAEEP